MSGVKSSHRESLIMSFPKMSDDNGEVIFKENNKYGHKQEYNDIPSVRFIILILRGFCELPYLIYKCICALVRSALVRKNEQL